MSTVSEIEAALPTLSSEDLRRIETAVHRAQRQQREAPVHDTSAPRFHDLDSLIGVWREDAEFDAAIRAFEQVDEAMWK
jgi:mRNA degradation ribonuclease J1/J2